MYNYDEVDDDDEGANETMTGGECPATLVDLNYLGNDSVNTNWTEVCKDQNFSSSTNSTNIKSNNESFAPQHVPGYGIQNGLRVVIDTLPCGWLPSSLFRGVSVQIHNPDAFPEVGQRGVILDRGTVNHLSVSAIFTDTTAAAISSYTNQTRGCNHLNERKLVYYSNYSRSNCNIETKVGLYNRTCGCKPYYFPGNFPVCNGQGMDCVNNVTNLDNLLSDCIPSCKEVSYRVSSTSARIGEDKEVNLRILNFMHLTQKDDL